VDTRTGHREERSQDGECNPVRLGLNVRVLPRKRLECATNLFREAGFSPAEARARGELMDVYIMMSEEADFSDKSEGERLCLRRRQVRSLVR